MTFATGQKVRATDLNSATPLMVRCTSNTSVTSSTTPVPVTGMSAAIEAGAEYILDGYIGYFAGATGDLKVALSVPTGTTGHWGLFGVTTGSSGDGGTEGDLTGLRQAGFGTANAIAVGGSSNNGGRALALPRGYLSVTTTGSLTVLFAQNTSDSATTQILSGSWLRLWRVS